MLCRLGSILVALVAGLVHGAPSQATRILCNVDFEERRPGNPEPLPMRWTKIEDRAFPHYVNGQLATDRKRGGDYSFRFDLNGGSLAYRYDHRYVPIKHGAHYRIDVYVQTTVLPHARARLTAWLVDADGHALAETVRHSEPWAAAAANDPWKLLRIDLSAQDKRAAYLAVQLELLQPAVFAPTSLGHSAIFPQDIRGSAWFDDLTVAQVPKLSMRAERPGNLFRAGQPVAIAVRINDRFTSDLTAQLVIRDATGRVVYQRSGALDLSAAADVGPDKLARLLLPELPPGWYEAAVVMTSSAQVLGEQKLAVVLLPDGPSAASPDERFGLIATGLPFDCWGELPRVLPALGAGRVKLAVWNAQGDIHENHSAAFDQLLFQLQELRITPTAVLLSPPPSVARRLGTDSWLGLLKAPKEQWQPQLAFMVSRHAAHLDRWQLGGDGSDAFVTHKDMRQVYARVYAEFASLVQKPDLAMPWPAWYELDGKLPATVALSVPSTVLPSQIPLYMQDIARHEGHNLSLTFDLLDRARYGRDLQIRDLVERVVYALSAGASRIDLPLPLMVERAGDEVIAQPQELLMIVRTLVNTLSGAAFRGKVPIADDVEAFLFERHGQGIVAIWNMRSQAGARQLALHLGDKPVRVDLWGNVTALRRPREAIQQSGQVELSLDHMPVFLVDVDAHMAQLRASVRFDRPLIESSFSAHARRIRFVNPYRQTISGTLRLTAPAGWSISPPTFTFSVNPGETFERDVSIEFPYSSFAGAKTVHAEFNIQADRNTSLRVPLTLQLGLSDVGMRTLALRDGNDVLVQQMITNYGSRPIDYSAFAMYPGAARQERLVTGLGPGRSTLKRYRFTNVKFDAKSVVRVGVKELDGTRILNDQVEIQ